MTMQHIKIQPTLLTALFIENERICSQVRFMTANPSHYKGDVLYKQAMTILQWHCEEQRALLESLQGHVRRINALIDKADKALQANAFKAGQADKIRGETFDNWLQGGSE